MGHSHSHDAHHHHHHAHSSSADRRRLVIALILAVSYMLAEVIGGWISGSLALLADAGHMLSDAGSLALSLFAAWIATRPGTSQQTFGYLRAEILAAAINGATLVAVAIGIAWEAWHRWSDPLPLQPALMAWIAAGGLVVNLLMLMVLHGGDRENLNIRGAWLHVLGDTLGSVGVLLAAGMVSIGWLWADAAVSLFIALLVTVSAVRLLSDATAVLMENSPHGISVDEVRATLLAESGVQAVHCLHVWSISTSLKSISAHVVLQRDAVYESDLARLRDRLREQFDVHHLTLQLEPSTFAGCDDDPTCKPQ